jgi:hypothetical protein
MFRELDVSNSEAQQAAWFLPLLCVHERPPMLAASQQYMPSP